MPSVRDTALRETGSILRPGQGAIPPLSKDDADALTNVQTIQALVNAVIAGGPGTKGELPPGYIPFLYPYTTPDESQAGTGAKYAVLFPEDSDVHLHFADGCHLRLIDDTMTGNANCYLFHGVGNLGNITLTGSLGELGEGLGKCAVLDGNSDNQPRYTGGEPGVIPATQYSQLGPNLVGLFSGQGGKVIESFTVIGLKFTHSLGNPILAQSVQKPLIENCWFERFGEGPYCGGPNGIVKGCVITDLGHGVNVGDGFETSKTTGWWFYRCAFLTKFLPLPTTGGTAFDFNYSNKMLVQKCLVVGWKGIFTAVYDENILGPPGTDPSFPIPGDITFLRCHFSKVGAIYGVQGNLTSIGNTYDETGDGNFSMFANAKVAGTKFLSIDDKFNNCDPIVFQPRDDTYIEFHNLQIISRNGPPLQVSDAGQLGLAGERLFIKGGSAICRTVNFSAEGSAVKFYRSTLPGTLSTRTSNTVGILTLDGGHNVHTGLIADILWSGGSRTGVTIGTIAVRSVPFSGGTGDNLPVATTDITIRASAVRFSPEIIDVDLTSSLGGSFAATAGATYSVLGVKGGTKIDSTLPRLIGEATFAGPPLLIQDYMSDTGAIFLNGVNTALVPVGRTVGEVGGLVLDTGVAAYNEVILNFQVPAGATVRRTTVRFIPKQDISSAGVGAGPTMWVQDNFRAQAFYFNGTVTLQGIVGGNVSYSGTPQAVSLTPGVEIEIAIENRQSDQNYRVLVNGTEIIGWAAVTGVVGPTEGGIVQYAGTSSHIIYTLLRFEGNP